MQNLVRPIMEMDFDSMSFLVEPRILIIVGVVLVLTIAVGIMMKFFRGTLDKIGGKIRKTLIDRGWLSARFPKRSLIPISIGIVMMAVVLVCTGLTAIFPANLKTPEEVSAFYQKSVDLEIRKFAKFEVYGYTEAVGNAKYDLSGHVLAQTSVGEFLVKISDDLPTGTVVLRPASANEMAVIGHEKQVPESWRNASLDFSRFERADGARITWAVVLFIGLALAVFGVVLFFRDGKMALRLDAQTIETAHTFEKASPFAAAALRRKQESETKDEQE